MLVKLLFLIVKSQVVIAKSKCFMVLSQCLMANNPKIWWLSAASFDWMTSTSKFGMMKSTSSWCLNHPFSSICFLLSSIWFFPSTNSPARIPEADLHSLARGWRCTCYTMQQCPLVRFFQSCFWTNLLNISIHITKWACLKSKTWSTPPTNVHVFFF